MKAARYTVVETDRRARIVVNTEAGLNNEVEIPAQYEVPREADDDLTLVHATRRGDVSAFEKLVRKYDRKSLRIAQNIMHSREDAEDAVQEAFFRAYKKLRQFQASAKFSTWLIRIVLNESLMKLRKTACGSERFALRLLPKRKRDCPERTGRLVHRRSGTLWGR